MPSLEDFTPRFSSPSPAPSFRRSTGREISDQLTDEHRAVRSIRFVRARPVRRRHAVQKVVLARVQRRVHGGIRDRHAGKPELLLDVRERQERRARDPR